MEGSRLTGVYRFLTDSKESSSRRNDKDVNSTSQPIQPQSHPSTDSAGHTMNQRSAKSYNPIQESRMEPGVIRKESSTSTLKTSKQAERTNAVVPKEGTTNSHNKDRSQKSTLELAEFLRTSDPEEFKRYAADPGEKEKSKGKGSKGFFKRLGLKRKSSIEIRHPSLQSLPGFVEQNNTAEGHPYYSIRVEQQSSESDNEMRRVSSVRNVPYAGSDQDADYYLDRILSSHEHANMFGATSGSAQSFTPYIPFSAPSRNTMARKDHDPHRMHSSLLPSRSPSNGSRSQQEVILGSRASSRTLVDRRAAGSTTPSMSASRRPSWQSDRPPAGPPPSSRLPSIPQVSETGSVQSSRRSQAPSSHRTKSNSSTHGSVSTNNSRILILEEAEETEHEQREREIRMLQRKLHDMDMIHASMSTKLREGNLEEALDVLSGGTTRPQRVASSQDIKRLSAQLQDYSIALPQSPKSPPSKPQTPALTDRPQSLTESDSSWGSTRKYPHIDRMIGKNKSDSGLWEARLKALQDKNAILERALLCVLQEKSRGEDTSEMEELILSQMAGEQDR